MTVRLKSLELEDFKTYYGKHVIGPFSPFTGLVGPNGGGKSNFMDAVAFVLGEQLKGLRVSHSSQLINLDRMLSGSESDGDSLPPSTSVTAVFALPDGGECAFQRIMCSEGSTFLVAGKSVSWQTYQEELRKVGIDAVRRNFMVFQGMVESIATEGSHVKTELFEEISGSGELAEEYNRLKSVMEKAEEKAIANFERRRMVMGDLRDCRHDLKKESEYKALEEERDKTKLKLQLFRLYYIEKESKSTEKELQKAEQHLEEVEERRREQAGVVEEKVERQGVALKDITTLDHSFGDLEIRFNCKRTEVITAKEVLAERQQKAESCHKLLSKATEGKEAQRREVEVLREELRKVEELAAKYEEELSQESMRMGTDIELEEEQLKEYHRLKQVAAQCSATYQQRLGKLSRLHKTQLDALANEERKMEEGKAALQRKDKEVKEAVNRAEDLKEKLKVFIKAEADKSLMLEEYKERVTIQKKKFESVKEQLVAVTEKLSEAVWDVDQSEKQQAKEELVHTLCSLFKGVYNRLGNLCEPIHERYQIAITRVLSKHLDSIVVDTVQTAERCIKYLADKRIGRETFLPLNYLHPPSIRESLRAIKEPAHVHLAFDLLKFEPSHIRVAVLFATKDTLVCETPEDAMTVAYDLLDERGNERHLSAVALDGTFYCKSGLMSGGKMELEKKARRWGKKNVVTMRKERDSLLDELRKAQKIGREESEMKILESQVMGLKNQVKYIAVEEDKILRHVSQITEEMQKLEEELEKSSAAYEVMKAKVAEEEAKITQLQTEMEKAENEVFASFCREIGIPSIRLYEEQGLQVMTERANKRLQFEKQKSRIQSQIKYEKSRDKDADVERWRAVVEAQRALVEKAKEDERKKAKEAEELMKVFAREKVKRVDKARVLREMEEEVELAQEKARKIWREKTKAQQKVSACKQKIKALEVERHNILKYCHIKGVELPIKRGSLKHVALREGAPLSTSATQSSSPLETPSSLVDTQRSEAEIEVDFSSLPSALKKVENEEHQKKSESLIQLKIRSFEKTLSAMHPPSKNTNERMEQAMDQMQEMNTQVKELQQQAIDAKEAFEEVKQRRYTLFMDCFSTVAAKIDEVYKGLCQSNQAQALLETCNPEEPYLSPVIYHCIPPGKRCQSMGGLSGGEKSVTALAFLFALHSYHPAPFFLLDEVDAALDAGNIQKMAEYINQLRESVTVLVISHRFDLYHKADALFGITYDMVNEYARSKVYSLDLMQYRKDRSWRPRDGGDGNKMPTQGRHSDRRRRRDGKRKDERGSDEVHSAGTQSDSQHRDRRRRRNGRDSDEIQIAGTHCDERDSVRRSHRDGRDDDKVHIAGTHGHSHLSTRRRHRDGRHSDERGSYRRQRDGTDKDETRITGTHTHSHLSTVRRNKHGRDSGEIHSVSSCRGGRDSDEIHSAGTCSDEI